MWHARDFLYSICWFWFKPARKPLQEQKPMTEVFLFLLNSIVIKEAFVFFLWLSTFLHYEKSYESENIIFLDGLMRNMDTEMSPIWVWTFSSTVFCVCVCDIAVFAVCTCKMKVKEMIYFYTIFMQILSVESINSQAYRWSLKMLVISLTSDV